MVSFSPLFIGAMGETTFVGGFLEQFLQVSVPYSSGQWVKQKHPGKCTMCQKVSVPYSSGQWVKRLYNPDGARRFILFQSPIHRGNG